MSLDELFRESFTQRRDDVALECTGEHGTRESLTFGDIDQRAHRMANALHAHGLRRGDRVVVHLVNRLEYIDLFLAGMRLGVVLVPMNVLYREREIAHITADSAPRLVITADDHRALFPAGTPLVAVESLAAEAAAMTARAGDHVAAGDDPLAIVYTSGTTGRAKGAVLSHDNFAANTRALIEAWRITSDDRYLAVLPLFHVHGLANGLCSWLASGCRMRLVQRFEAERAAQWFDTFQPTLFFGVPTIYVRLLEIAPDVAQRIGARMRLFVSGSAPLPAQVFEAFRERFGHAILERYGMSETLMLISNPYEGERRPGTVGMPLPGVSVRLDTRHSTGAADGADHTHGADGAHAADGGGGEVLVRGRNVFSGYWNAADSTTAAFDDGWFRTGDIAVCSGDGYYTLRGRVSDLIICNGFNVYPREIEEVLMEQPGVREAAVVGAPDDVRGEVPVAYLVTDAPLDADALQAACLRALAPFKAPRAFIRVSALPRNALGKVQRHLLPARSGS